MTTPHTIRSITELEALDPETWLLGESPWHEDPIVMCWLDWSNDYRIDPTYIFPLVVIATGDQVRAARKALEDA